MYARVAQQSNKNSQTPIRNFQKSYSCVLSSKKSLFNEFESAIKWDKPHKRCKNTPSTGKCWKTAKNQCETVNIRWKQKLGCWLQEKKFQFEPSPATSLSIGRDEGIKSWKEAWRLPGTLQAVQIKSSGPCGSGKHFFFLPFSALSPSGSCNFPGGGHCSLAQEKCEARAGRCHVNKWRICFFFHFKFCASQAHEFF